MTTLTKEPDRVWEPNYETSIRFGANWTLLSSAYLIVVGVVLIAAGGFEMLTGEIEPWLQIAGNRPVFFAAGVLLDGLFHAVFFVTVVTLYTFMRERMPIRAILLLVFGAWQMILGLTKGFSSLLTFAALGEAYVAADPALQAVLIPVAEGQYGLRLALQIMDSFGIVGVWLLVSLLPARTGIPRSVRWLGWILTLAAVAAMPVGPSFMLVILLFPVWLFIMGRWLKSQVSPSNS